MAKGPDKQQRKERIALWRAEQRTSARDNLPLSTERMKALFDMLNSGLPQNGCDHTLRLTTGWLHLQGIPVEPVLSWLRDNGGYCDCEALANAEQAWKEAMKDDA